MGAAAEVQVSARIQHLQEALKNDGSTLMHLYNPSLNGAFYQAMVTILEITSALHCVLWHAATEL